ncbi:MAG TPA: PQQ-binding-like beta-propeller repeat protein, partial [Acidimicrobiales bacterium]|nr:PQQ-binding-like beta-propeller repeat protein [Acidimicrobiales bacterium]
MERTTTERLRIAVASLVVGSLTMATGGVVTAAGASPTPPGSWPYANGNLANTRVAIGSSITLANVKNLKPAWTYTLKGNAATNVGGYGTLATNPIVVNGVVYLQDLHCNVYALSLATGKLIWKYVVNRKELSGPGPNGVAVVDGTVYGLTPTTAFALNAATGREVWSNDHLLKKGKGTGEGTFGIQPQVADGRVYLASQYGEVPGGGRLFALNAATGAELWSFETVPGKDKGVETLGLGAGGAWDTPLVGTDGSVTYGIGNPYQFVQSAFSEPGKVLYTDSDVNLDAATGKLRWYYQAVPNDF